MPLAGWENLNNDVNGSAASADLVVAARAQLGFVTTTYVVTPPVEVTPLFVQQADVRRDPYLVPEGAFRLVIRQADVGQIPWFTQQADVRRDPQLVPEGGARLVIRQQDVGQAGWRAQTADVVSSVRVIDSVPAFVYPIAPVVTVFGPFTAGADVGATPRVDSGMVAFQWHSGLGEMAWWTPPADVVRAPRTPWTFVVEPVAQPVAPRAGWQPNFVDEILRPGPRAADQRAFFGPDRQPVPPFTDAVYPAFITPIQLPIADRGTLADNPDPQPPPPFPGWLPSFLDFVWPQPGLRAADQEAFVEPARQPDPPGIAWRGAYPDYAWPLVSLVTAAQQAFVEPTRQPDPPVLAWRGWHPDALTAYVSPQQPVAMPTRQPEPTLTAWRGWQPDAIAAAATVPAQQAFGAPVRQPTPPYPAWRGWQPDAVDAVAPVPVQQPYSVAVRQPDPPPRAWHGWAPVRVRPLRGLRAAAQQAFAGPLRQPDPPARAWHGWAPDYIWPTAGLGVVGQQAFAGPARQPDPPALVWRPTVLDYVWPQAGLMAAAQQVTARPIAPIPPTGWRGVYADLVDRAVVISATQRAFFGPESPTPPALAWRGWYPDTGGPIFVRVWMPTGGAPGGVPTPSTAWHGWYPDAVGHPARVTSAAATAALTIEPPLTWQPAYTPIVWAPPRGPNPGGATLVIVPAPPSGGQDVAIHAPDEIAPNLAQGVSVELLVGGTPVVWDAPGPSLRVYHLDGAGAQVTDLALTVMPQNGANPSYTLPWTPTTVGVYMFDIRGAYLGVNVQKTQPITVRSVFDPIALALQDIFVNRTQIS